MASVDDWTATGSTLAPGVTHVTNVAPRSNALHRLTLAHLRETSGRVFWIDARDTATTYPFYAAPSTDHLLSSIRIARAWTAYQHHTLIRQLVDRVSPRTCLVVLPNIYSLYTDDDLDQTESEHLVRSSLTTIAALASTYDLPVVLSAPTADATTLAPFVDYELIGESTTTSATPIAATTGLHGWQTTLPYWADVAGTRDEACVELLSRYRRLTHPQQVSLAIEY